MEFIKDIMHGYFNKLLNQNLELIMCMNLIFLNIIKVLYWVGLIIYFVIVVRKLNRNKMKKISKRD